MKFVKPLGGVALTVFAGDLAGIAVDARRGI